MKVLARVAFLASLVALALVLFARAASAEAPRVEAAAKTALAKAEEAYLGMSFPQGLAILQKAERACGDDRCSNATHAALLRDIGTFQFRLRDPAGAKASFIRALKIDATLELNPNYDARDLRAPWAAAKDAIVAASQPGEGDFVHTPAREQKVTTPLPVYVEYHGSQTLVRVVVKYKNESMTSFKRTNLTRIGAGWGGYIPCVDVTEGLMRYYVQGFDENDLPAVSSGSPKVPFTVPIHDELSGDAPALPGMRAPETCADEALVTLRLDVGERCQEDTQCQSGVCSAGRCARPAPIENASGEYAQLWLGVSGSIDIAFLPAGADVCKLAGGAPTSGSYFCTNPDGSDFAPGSANDALVPGHAGQTDGGASAGNVHALLTLDFAATPNLLLGARFGYVANTYPGDAAVGAARTPPYAWSGEVRGTWLFGTDPLTLPGFVPYASLGAGYGRLDASTRVMVARSNVVGDKAVQAWFVGGPFFASIGTGLRYALSPRIGFWMGGKASVGFGTGGVLSSISPELGLHYGF